MPYIQSDIVHQQWSLNFMFVAVPLDGAHAAPLQIREHMCCAYIVYHNAVKWPVNMPRECGIGSRLHSIHKYFIMSTIFVCAFFLSASRSVSPSTYHYFTCFSSHLRSYSLRLASSELTVSRAGFFIVITKMTDRFHYIFY